MQSWLMATKPSGIQYHWTGGRGINYTVTRYTGSQLAAMGATLVRSKPPVTWRHEPTGTILSPTFSDWTPLDHDSREYTPVFDWTAFDAWLDGLEDYNVRTVIDVHTFPGFIDYHTCTASACFWFHPQYRQNAIKFYREVATHLGTRGNVIAGYDLLNEPQVPRDGTGFVGFPKDLTAQTVPTLVQQQAFPGYRPNDAQWQVGQRDPRSWVGLVDDLAAEIRTYDTKHPIIVEAHGVGGHNQGGYVERFVNTSGWYVPTNIPMLVFSVHDYKPNAYAEQTANTPLYTYPAAAGFVPGVSGEFNEVWVTNHIQHIRNFQIANPGLPIYIGEHSPPAIVDNGNPKPGAIAFLQLLTGLYNTYGWSWTYHTVNESPTSARSAKRDANFWAALQAQFVA